MWVHPFDTRLLFSTVLDCRFVFAALFPWKMGKVHCHGKRSSAHHPPSAGNLTSCLSNKKTLPLRVGNMNKGEEGKE